MDFKALIDFNKYTLALAAACTIYTLEKYTPQSTVDGRNYVVGILVVFVISVIAGVLIFSAATAAQHANESRQKRIQSFIKTCGRLHAQFLVLGILALALLVFKDATLISAKPSDDGCTRCCFGTSVAASSTTPNGPMNADSCAQRATGVPQNTP